MNKEAKLKSLIGKMFKSKAGIEAAEQTTKALKKSLSKSGKLPYKQRKELLKATGKSLIREPEHFKNPVTGAAARLKRETKHIKSPDAPFFAGLLMPKKTKTGWSRFWRNLDETLGEKVVKAGKRPGTLAKRKGAFVKSEYVRMPGTSKYKKHHYPSISAPVAKAATFGSPILASLYVGEKLSKPDKKALANAPQSGYNINSYPDYAQHNMGKVSHVREENMSNSDKILVPKKDIEKTAAALKQAGLLKDEKNGLIKEAQLAERAQKVAFEMVEKGHHPPFKSYEEFQEKVASLKGQDLDVVEKALEFNPHSISLGEVSDRTGKGSNAIENFVMDDN